MMRVKFILLLILIMSFIGNISITGQESIEGFSGELIYIRQASENTRELVHLTADSRQVFSLTAEACFWISAGSLWEGERDYVVISSESNPDNFSIYNLHTGALILEHPWDESWIPTCGFNWIGTSTLGIRISSDPANYRLIDLVDGELSPPILASNLFDIIEHEPICVFWSNPYHLNSVFINGMYCDEFEETIPDFDPEHDVYIGTPNPDWIILRRCIDYDNDNERCVTSATVLFDLVENEIIEVLRNAPSIWVHYTGNPAGKDKFVWSPTSNELAYLQIVPDGVLLVIFDAISGEYHYEITIEGDYRRSIPGLVWSPDNQMLAFIIRSRSDERQLVIFNVVTGDIFVDPEPHNYQFSTQALKWSPDSQSIIYIEPETDTLQFFNAETYERTALDDGIIRIWSWE